MSATAEFNTESYLLQLPGGYALLDMLVQANVNLTSVSPAELQRLLGPTSCLEVTSPSSCSVPSHRYAADPYPAG